MKHLVLAVIVLFALSTPATAHHTKEHVLQPPTAATAPAPDETGMQLWYALGPFFLLVALGLVRWGLKHRAARRSHKD